MNLLFCCEFYHPSIGGVQEVMRQIAERMVERGHSVAVATSRLRNRKFVGLNGVRVVEFDINGNSVRGMSGDVDAYRMFVEHGKFDLVFIKAAQQWTFDALLPVLADLKMKKVFVPCGFSGLYDPAYAEYFHRMPDILRQFDQLLFYATDYRDIRLAREHGLTKISIVPNGASEREFGVRRDSLFRQRNGIPEDAFVVLTVGSLNGYKGHREIADAFSRIDFGERKAFLLLNGNQPSAQGLIRRIISTLSKLRRRYREGGFVATARWLADKLLERLSLSGNRVNLPGPLNEVKEMDLSLAKINQPHSGKLTRLVDFSRPELIQAYLNSDLFVFASNIEYSPLVLFEAAAAGLPFISAPVGNAEEIASWTGGGEICPAPCDEQGYTRIDPAVLAKHIERLAKSPDKLRLYSDSGRRNWSERYTWDKVTDLYEVNFLQLLSGQSKYVESDS